MSKTNPFALVKASDYTDEQINTLWVELGEDVINAIIEPKERNSKFVLGGKGTGKTHLLRYHSYFAARLRNRGKPGLDVVAEQGFFSVFVRATGLDANRFTFSSGNPSEWQQLFGVYFDLRMAELILGIMFDIKKSSVTETFNDSAFISALTNRITDSEASDCESIEQFFSWVTSQRKKIDLAVNNAAFTRSLDVRVPISFGDLTLNISKALGVWNYKIAGLPVIFLVDEIENFSEPQQEVLNTLIRYGEGVATFRVTGRLYAIKTSATIAGGEENREGAEISTTFSDEFLRDSRKFKDFSLRFVRRRLSAAEDQNTTAGRYESFDVTNWFEEIRSDRFYAVAVSSLGLDSALSVSIERFSNAFSVRARDNGLVQEVVETLTSGFPAVLQKLNLLLFCKRFKRYQSHIKAAFDIRNKSLEFFNDASSADSSYRNAYSQYSRDLFAQLCRDGQRKQKLPYAGFSVLVRMALGNPRNLLILLNKIYSTAIFEGFSLKSAASVPVSIQTKACYESALFLYEADTNFGKESDEARVAIDRIGTMLRAARYSLNIPEVSPLAITLSVEDLDPHAFAVYKNALKYSLIFGVKTGRADRNSSRVNRKIQLNPMLAPRWGLPTNRRGDIPLNKRLANAVFDPRRGGEFQEELARLEEKWNSPFQTGAVEQGLLF